MFCKNLDNISIETDLYSDVFICIKEQLAKNHNFNSTFFINNENVKFNTLAADLLGKQHNISVNWEKKHNIFTRNELDKIKQTTQKAILVLKLFYVDKKIDEIKKKIVSIQRIISNKINIDDETF